MLLSVFSSIVVFSISTLILGGSMIIAGETFLPSLVLFILFISVSFLIGLATAGFSALTKHATDPFSWASGWINRFATGIYYPLAILPFWLQNFAWILPQTHAINGIRLILLGGQAWHPSVVNSLVYLAILNIILVVLGPLLFHIGFKKAKKEGNLGYY